MSAAQVVLYAVLALIAAYAIRRFLLVRALQHYTPAQVAEKLRTGEPVVLLDVRTDSERQRSSIKGSIHIPMHQVRSRLDDLKKHQGKEIICFCAVGGRSAAVAAMLHKQGFTVANITGGISAWKSSGLP